MIIQIRFSRLRRFPFTACLLAVFSWPALPQPSLDFVTGKALFEKNWVPAPASTTASDGLGPFYNARSCNQCHAGGGRGSRKQSLVLHSNDPVYGGQLQKYALAGMMPEAVMEYVFSDAGDTAPTVSISALAFGEMSNPAVSARIAPPLQGLGKLAAIPDAVITSLADPDDSDGDGLSGRVNRVTLADGSTAIGRFGWKASQPTLKQQIARALSLDLGLGNPVFPSGYGDCSESQRACYRAPDGNSGHHDGLETNNIVLDLLLAYVRELPIENGRNSGPEAGGQGALLFSRIGCAGCHLPEIQGAGQTLSPYTDLLLHDMGPGLADDLKEGSAAGNEWRTAPLRGLGRPGQFFLHDGRALTLEQAIRWHGGEAARAREQFEGLGGQEKSDLINFIIGL